MQLSTEAKAVLSELLVNLSVVTLVSIPGYFIVQDYFRLTLAIIYSILALRIAIRLRKESYE